MKRKYRIMICFVIAMILGVAAGEIFRVRPWHGWFSWTAGGTCVLVWGILYFSFCREP